MWRRVIPLREPQRYLPYDQLRAAVLASARPHQPEPPGATAPAGELRTLPLFSARGTAVMLVGWPKRPAPAGGRLKPAIPNCVIK